ncbi:hypothetical protein F9C11_20305 [Amycolatopsis sp. VS8301801F10]|uniref:hypothetical protein n=1 Tax=unclassified Amycolatopsis TaxID=2618356 RepID=UPI0038FCAA30
MNDFDTLDRIVRHAKAWGLDDRVESMRFTPVPVVRMRDDDVAMFGSWAKHLSQPRLRIEAGSNRAVLTVTGLIMCGKPVAIAVDVQERFLPDSRHSAFCLSIEDFVAVVATRQRVLAPAKAGA